MISASSLENSSRFWHHGRVLSLTHLEDGALSRLPMFPLPGGVLFPGQTMSLYVFEPRYRALMRACLAENHAMAVSFLESESQSGAPVRTICGGGQIIASEELEDGCWNVLLQGTDRLRIVTEVPTDEPFRRVEVQRFMESRGPNDQALAGQLRTLMLQISEVLPDAQSLLHGLAGLAKSPSHLCDLVGAHIVDPAELRQELLETRSVEERLERTIGAMSSALLHLIDLPESGALH